MIRPLGAALLALVLTFPAVAADEMVGHRAVYDLSLVRGSPGGGSMNGRLAMDFKRVCDGYTLTQRFRTETVGDGGEKQVGDYSVTSWEAADGSGFRFNIKHEHNGNLDDEYDGRSDTRTAKATFNKPAGLELDLPAGTVYPTEHLVRLIAAARRGDRVAPLKVFDGSADDGVYDVGGFIGKPFEKEAGADTLLAPLKGLDSWHVRLAYFPHLAKTDVPDYELAFRLYANGVSSDLVLDYGEYALKGVLVNLEIHPAPRC